MRIIFHHPLPLNEQAKSASGIRPLRMLNAFKSMGVHVELVTGYSSERKRCIENIKDNIKSGVRYDFVYSESSTMPTILTDPNHLPLHPFLDFSFFRFCNKNNIPIGLFYRDIYWLFESYGLGLNPVKKAIAKAAYLFDLWVYQHTLSQLYLPSIEMGRYVPCVDRKKFGALPPGHSEEKQVSEKSSNHQSRRLKLFYVGGMSNHYQLHELFKAVAELPQVELTVCTRKIEWQAAKAEYPTSTPNIRVIHKTGVAMEDELRASDVAVLFVKPQEYREFASPVKLYEYLGALKPILASEGTLAGKFVRDNGVGWTIPYELAAIYQLLAHLVDDSSAVSELHRKMREVASQHSWQARAQQVIGDLTP